MTLPPALVWEDGVPRSSRFGDIYYSLEDGLAEARAVFLAGCGLPGAWAGRSHFTVGELGFGTGLNIAALLHLWRETREAGAHLHIFSIEAFPPSREDAARALAGWPELAEEANALLAAWPAGRRGFQRFDLAAWNATLDLAVMEVGPALEAWSGRADAWFLDGFSPALNPQMWSPEIMAAVAARSAPGGVAATFTVAGFVRRGLEAAGFTVAKQPGHGRKKQRLEAVLPGQAEDPPPRRIAVIGAGIAGAALARAFEVEGVMATVFASQAQLASSGNPAALVTPALDAGGGARAALYSQAFARAVALYEALPDTVIARGAQLDVAGPKDGARFAAVAAQDLFDPGRLTLNDRGLWFEDGLVVRPAAVLAAWTGAVVDAEVQVLTRESGHWVLGLADGRREAFDVVIIAAGWGAHALTPDLPLQPVRGQASWVTGMALTAATTGFGGYAIPMDGGVLFGATHDREVTGTEVRSEDHQRNLETLAKGQPDLAAALAGQPMEGRAAIRVATPDRLPMAGQIEPGLFILTGLGSRGFTTAPLLAEYVAALALDRPSPLPAALARLVSPLRNAPARSSVDPLIG
jgi:tRNA 5-methylaminomethyl-2-thiouridine biosynthesis bifunctional protein